MSNIPVARRYARALLDAAGASADQVLEHLESLTAFIESHGELYEAIASPALTRTQRTALTQALITGATGLHPLVANLLKLLTDRNRFSSLPLLTRQYRDLVDARLGRVRGQVTSPRPLSAEQVAGIRKSLEALSQRSVLLETKLDPSLIGGVVAQVGSRVYDGSLKNQLRSLAQTLSQPVR